MITHLFVYGTLRQGQARWSFLSPYVTGDGEPDTAAGLLFDTGHGYPAAVFGGPGTICGHTYELAHDTMAVALQVLDREEATVEGLFHRVEIVTVAGTPAFAYAYREGLALTPIPSGDWFRR